MSKAKTVSVHLTQAELWELISNFDASYEAGAEGNEIADRVSLKLAKAYRTFRHDEQPR